VELSARDVRGLARALIGVEEVLTVGIDETEGRLFLETRGIERFNRRLTQLAAEGQYGIRSLECVDASLEAVFDYLVT